MKKNLLLIIALLFFAGWQMQAQTDELPEIEKELLQMEREAAEGNLNASEMLHQQYLNIMYYFHSRDMEKTHLYFQKALAFLREKKDIKNEALVLTQMGDFYSMWGKMDTADVFFDDALKIIEGKGFYRVESIIHRYKGGNFAIVNDVTNAMREFFYALEMNKKDKEQKITNKQNFAVNLIDEVDILLGISGIYYNMTNLDKTKEYLLRIQKIIDDNRDYDMMGMEFPILPVTGNLASVYWETGQYDEAFPLMKKYHELAIKEEELGSIVLASKLLSDYFRIVEKDFLRAQTYAKEAIEIAEQTQIPYLINVAERVMMTMCITLKDYKTALRYAESVLARCEEDDWESLENVYGELVRIYAFMGDMEKSDSYQVKHRQITAKMSDKNLHSALQGMEVKYEVEQKEQAHQAELKRKQTFQYILIGGLVLTALLIGLLIYIVTLRNKRNRELAEMNATKDKFFSIISHDLKNPAIAQRDALQLLLDNSEKWDKDALTNYYSKLLKSADSQVILLYNMLNWAYLQTGKMPFVANPFNLKAVLKSDIALIQNMAEQKGVTFNINMPEQTTVTGDDNMLTIVIRNLLTNAVKFTPTGGTVTLDIAPIGAGFTISISDTGTGMTPDQLQNLFRLDAKRSTTGTAGEQGSGLGLIVCKELVEKHGSTLNVDSENGMGSRFWFEI